MKLKCFAAGLIAACFTTAPVWAADYPAKPLHVVVPWPAGGLVDLPARLVAEKLQKSLGVAVIVENKPGAGGMIGAAEVARSAPDGYTIMLTTSAMNMNAAIRSNMPFDVNKDFEPIAGAAYTSLILVAAPEGPQSLAQIIAAARKSPGKLSYASAGAGTPGNFAGEMLKTAEKLDIVHVPYKGGPPAMIDQMSGLVDFHFANAAVALPQISANKVKALAVASAKRMPQLPQVPTMAEAGVGDFDLDQWIGYLAPAGTPAEIIGRLNKAITAAIGDKELQATLERSGMTAATGASAQDFKSYVQQDFSKWAKVAQSANIKLD
ncbi:Bug family tripartite tricarboxylate transporter substrate binding protein [Pollutimonas bauzanensis]|uniref:Tripartite-type tricarboxylate transporter, receptor component TctC n=1 Tax=Pollutimonas bauzanensis TaxID=658167 RepID=A0A1M5UND1_9BURK|nr:tripartite tricarboxylate transporter substrate binding protein [Pollutimonas bauzanensis]SHH64525.1 Tripartite-type tricarboxylate transporter, receptor component TctC [Pollutimonas bauzanensis]